MVPQWNFIFEALAEQYALQKYRKHSTFTLEVTLIATQLTFKKEQ